MNVFTVDMEASTVEKKLPRVPLAVWGAFTENSIDVLAQILVNQGLVRGTIGLEMDHLLTKALERLKFNLLLVKFGTAQDLLNGSRMIKSTREIDALHKLSRISDQSIAESLSLVGAGSPEMDIVPSLTHGIYACGAQDFKFIIIAIDERSKLLDSGPTRRLLQEREFAEQRFFLSLMVIMPGFVPLRRFKSLPDMQKEFGKYYLTLQIA